MEPKKPNNKRMVYIWDENLDFYDGLDNKSDTINQFLQEQARLARKQPNIDFIRKKVAEMDAKAKGE